MTSERKAVVLLSGGLDSTTTLAIAKARGFRLYALTFSYGQRHAIEVDAARRIAAKFEVEEHVILPIDLRSFGGSALTDEVPVPKDRDQDEIESGGIPATYVPARNTIFLSYALAWAEVIGASDIFIGVNSVDYSGYPDCRAEFVEAFQQMARLATRAGVEEEAPLLIHTPLIDVPKKEIIRRGIELGVDYGMTTSCYDPAASGAACGRCDSCVLRLKGFEQAGSSDPITYQSRPDS
ncbi:7-cyano-7-deazaguanine synthase QueC [Gemmatimonadota bacterium]